MRTDMRKIQVVFDGPPAHESGRFVEVEEDGKGVNFGEWKQREDGYWVLEFDIPSPPDRDDDAKSDDAIREKVKRLVRLCQDVDWTNILEMLDYFERIGSAWPHAASQLRPFISEIRSSLAEVEE
jgi:hypothetical protein